MDVLIIALKIKSEAESIAKDISLFLREKDIKSDVIFIDSTEGNLNSSKKYDLVITLGGDGTVLFASRSFISTPILPINLGSFGFISDIGKDEWRDTLTIYLEKGISLYKRVLLSVKVLREGKEVFYSPSLNEAVVTSSGISKVITLSLFLDHTFSGRFRSDGMIVSTPTGSTAYSLASGGPILESELEALVITPVCPFSLSARPLVIGDKVVTLLVDDKQRTEIVLTVDGQVFFKLKEGDKVVINMDKRKLSLVLSQKRNFTEIIRDKLHWGGENVSKS